jgi:flagellar biosynthetic protein FlhB
MAEDSQEKKLAPSHHKRQEARRFGNIPSSRDLSTALGALAATAVLGSTGFAVISRLRVAITDGFLRMGSHPTHDLNADDLTAMLISGGMLIGTAVGPIALAAAGASAGATLLQTSFSFNTHRLKLHWDRLSPSSNFEKLKPSNAGINTLKTILIGIVLSILGWRLGKPLAAESARLVWSHPLESMGYGWEAVTRLLWQGGFVFLIVGAVDHYLQKWKHTKSLKMSHQEMREEHKMTEQKPEVKQAIRKAQREMRKRSMMKSVKTATVVITNPTHFAIALKYDREKSPAPIVVAKGADLIALKIRELARHHSVPVIENPPLARALFKDCEIGDTIPGPLFGAVAEVLAYLIRIKQLVL